MSKKTVVIGMAVAGIIFQLSVANTFAAASFNLKNIGNSDCLGVKVNLGGTMYTLTRGGEVIMCVGGSISTGASISTTLQWMGGSSGGSLTCAGSLTDICSGTFNLSRSSSSSVICRVAVDTVRTLSYTITSNTSCGVLGSWDIKFSANEDPIGAGGR